MKRLSLLILAPAKPLVTSSIVTGNCRGDEARQTGDLGHRSRPPEQVEEIAKKAAAMRQLVINFLPMRRQNGVGKVVIFIDEQIDFSLLAMGMKKEQP
ncbi:MAG: hypothetical protein R3E79_47485 [Caldilineaceae bacterium]